MKQGLLFILSVLMCLQNTYADSIIVENVQIAQGGQSIIKINLTNNEKSYTAGQIALQLPDGISAVTDTNGAPTYEKGERLISTNHTIGSSHLSNGMEQFTIFSINSEPIPGTEGNILNIMISASEDLEVGTVLEGHLTNIEMTTTDAVSTPFNNISFSITIVEPQAPWIILDENSTTLPEATKEEVSIKVIRTIKANSWNAICLPFAMTEPQVYNAFGEDVQLAIFDSYYINDDNSDINIVFDDAGLSEYGFLANYPYIIKTSKDITEFIVTSTIEPNEDDAIVEYAEGRGPSKKVYGTFYGTLKAGEMIPKNNLLIEDNKFVYSTGLTEIIGFCGYFDISDINVDTDLNSTEIHLIVKNEVTGIETIIKENCKDGWYTIQGIKIDSPTSRNIYIRNGKKVYIK